jgi:hypothetical protein
MRSTKLEAEAQLLEVEVEVKVNLSELDYQLHQTPSLD